MAGCGVLIEVTIAIIRKLKESCIVDVYFLKMVKVQLHYFLKTRGERAKNQQKANKQEGVKLKRRTVFLFLFPFSLSFRIVKKLRKGI